MLGCLLRMLIAKTVGQSPSGELVSKVFESLLALQKSGRTEVYKSSSHKKLILITILSLKVTN